MFLAIFLSTVFCISGLWVSYNLNIASGAAIVILSILGYLACSLMRSLWRNHKMKDVLRKA